MSEVTRWKPTTGDINKIKMEVSDSGKYVKHSDYLALRQQLAEANAKVAELESINTFDAKRLRTLTNLLGMSVPESDETLLSCAGTVLGGMRRVIEDMFKTTNDLTAKVAELESNVIEWAETAGDFKARLLAYERDMDSATKLQIALLQLACEDVQSQLDTEREIKSEYGKRIDVLVGEIADLTARLEAQKEGEPVAWMDVKWIDGFPTKHYAEEWFIARTKHRDRVVLRALPEEYTYDFTTADGTFMMKENVVQWMQFPDSEFTAPQPAKQEAGEPVGVVVGEGHNFAYAMYKRLPKGTKLYAGAAPSSKKEIQSPVAWYCEAPSRDWDLYNSDERRFCTWDRSEMEDAKANGFSITEYFTTPQPTPTVQAAVAAAYRKAAEVCRKTRYALDENRKVWEENPHLTPDESYIYEWEQSACRGEEYAQDVLALPHDDSALREICLRVEEELAEVLEVSCKGFLFETVVYRVLGEVK